MPLAPPARPHSTLLGILVLWAIFYASFTLFFPPLLDDADSVHAEVAREMLLRHDYVTLYANGIRYLEKAPLLYWSMALSFKLFSVSTAAARIPIALTILALALTVEAFARRLYHRPGQEKTDARAGLYAALILLSSPGIFLFSRINLPDAMVCLWLTLALFAFYLTEGIPSEPAHDVVILSGAKNPRISSPLPTESGAPGLVSETWVPNAPQTRVPHPSPLDGWDVNRRRLLCYLFAACCALNVLTKGLIGIVFPIAIVGIYLLLTRGLRGAVQRIRQLHPWSSLAVFLLIAAPWHILIALANPTQGHPGALTFTLFPTTGQAHWHIPLPTDGNVHGWLWFYFVNEQLLRYLNLRVPRDYDTVPLYLFWGLCLIWLMPWSAFAFNAFRGAMGSLCFRRQGCGPRARAILAWGDAPGPGGETIGGLKVSAKSPPQTAEDAYVCHPVGICFSFVQLLLILWAFFPLLFFSLSTRQEYYVLPALPAFAILIAGWLAHADEIAPNPGGPSFRSFTSKGWVDPATAILLTLGTLFALATLIFLIHTRTAAPAPATALASLLQQNPGDYALSMGHFLDLNARALALFRRPLALAAASLLLGPLAAFLLRKRAKPHAANLALAAGAFGFLLAAHLGLQTFAPVLTSQQLAAAIAPQLKSSDLIVIHGEYEAASTLGFYLHRNDLHILEGRSSNLWYGSFFPDAPPIFETRQSLAEKWPGPKRIFLWQDLANDPGPLPPLPTPYYVLAKSGGKEILSNQP